MPTNDLYLVVLPMIHLTDRFGFTEQVLTLLPNSDFATVFTAEEVQGYIDTFNNRAGKYLTGGNVVGYTVTPEPRPGGNVVVRVAQETRQ